MMDDCTVAHLYKKIITPSVKKQNEAWQKQNHFRHKNFKSQSPVGHLKVASPIQSVISAPGHLERNNLSLQPWNEKKDVFAIDKTTTLRDHTGYNFHPTVQFKTTSLPAMSLSRKYSPSPTGTTRSVPISFSHNMGTPSRYWTNENPKMLYSGQRDRMTFEEIAKEHCRRMKRKSEIIQHRVDRQYYMEGTKVPLQGRFDVDSTDFLQLRLLSQQKQLSEYKAVKGANFVDSNQRDSPSGQLSTPVPDGSLVASSSQVLSSVTDLESTYTDGKWAEEGSELSSVGEFDSLPVKGRRQEFEARKALLAGSGKSEQSDISEGKANKGNLKVGNKNSSTGKIIKGSTVNKSVKKVQIRFKEEGKSTETQKLRKGGQKVKTKGQDEEKTEEVSEDNGGPKEEKRNKYLDEWLGIKRVPIDTRYQPGKPPPNRIFMTANSGNTKKSTEKFSSAFLTEITEVKDSQDDDDLVAPDARYGIIGEKQRHVFGFLFDEVDKDKNGSVTLEELKLKMQPAVSKHEIKHFVQVFDLNKDKTVDKREFTAICALNDRIAGIRTESEDASLALDLENLAQHIVIFKEMFKTIDEDDDNRLDAGELLVMVSAAMETEIGADLQTAKEVLEGARDEFGFIDFIGFMSYIPFFAKLMRTILDHPLDISELQRARERVRQQDLTFKPPKRKPKETKSWEVF